MTFLPIIAVISKVQTQMTDKTENGEMLSV